MINYPTEAPIGEIQSIVSNIRHGTEFANKALFAKDIWVIIGFANKQIFGEPGTVMSTSINMEDKSLDNEEACSLLESMIPTNNMAMIPIPWISIIKWAAQILLTLI